MTQATHPKGNQVTSDGNRTPREGSVFGDWLGRNALVLVGMLAAGVAGWVNLDNRIGYLEVIFDEIPSELREVDIDLEVLKARFDDEQEQQGEFRSDTKAALARIMTKLDALGDD